MSTPLGVVSQYKALQAILDKVIIWGTVSISLLQLSLLTAQIYHEMTHIKTETRSKGHWKLLNPLNALLYILIISNLLSIVFWYELYNTVDAAASNAYLALNNIFASIYQITIAYYVWIRGYPILNNIAPKALPFINLVCITEVVIQVAQNTVLILQSTLSPFSAPNYDALTSAYNALYISSAVLLILFDAFVLVCYSVHLHRQLEEVALFNKLTLISRFGIASCLWVVCWEVSAIAPMYMPYYSTPYQVLSVFFNMAPLVYNAVQCLMKWRLWRLRRKQESSLAYIVVRKAPDWRQFSSHAAVTQSAGPHSGAESECLGIREK
ncbi:hypothetical protein HDU80_008365 [Chytriomyces hyalinus]|nr:hypothetical protein HDU80_008365 [Chytriomyces hyalinus]